MMTIGVFVACFCVSTFVRHRMMGTKMSLFASGGAPPQAETATPTAATTKQESVNNAAGKPKKKSKKAD